MRFLLVCVILTVFAVPLMSQWSSVPRPSGGIIWAIEEIDSVLYAGTDANGIFRSADHGKSWEPFGLEGQYVRCISHIGAVLIAGTYYDGLFVSMGSNGQWVQHSSGLGSLNVNDLLVLTDTIVAATGAGVWMSVDTGMTWVDISGSLPNKNARHLASVSGSVFLQTAGGIYRKTAPDSSWTRVLLAERFFSSVESIDSLLFVGGTDGAYLSSDLGGSWVKIQHEDTALSSLSVWNLSASDNRIVAATTDGALMSSLDTLVWQSLPLSPFSSPRSVLTTDGHIFIGLAGPGIYEYSPSEMSWQQRNNGLAASKVMSIASTDTLLIVGTQENGLFLSTDLGTTWGRPDTIFDNRGIRAITFFGTHMIVATNIGMFLSDLPYSAWERIDNPLFGLTDYYSITVDESTIYAGGGNFGLYATGDSGKTWLELARQPTIDGVVSGHSLFGVAVVDSSLIVGTYKGVFVSPDNGKSWNASNAGLTNTYINSLTTHQGTTLAATDGGLHVSTDAGASWILADNSFAPGGTSPTGEALRRYSETAGYMGTYPIGIATSRMYIFVVLSDGTIVKRHVSDVVAEATRTDDDGPVAFSLLEAYPNPFNSTANISFSLPLPSRANLEVFNTLGQRIGILLHTDLTPGTYSYQWHPTVPSGIYFYRLEAVSVDDPSKRFVDVKKMVLLR